MSKGAIISWPMFDGGNADLSQSQLSRVSTVTFQDNIGIILSWTGSSPVGTVQVLISNDQKYWDVLDFGASISISGNSGSHNINMNELPFSYLRISYNRSSGTGTLQALLTAKRMGG